MNVLNLYELCKKSDTSFIAVVCSLIYYRMRGKQILPHRATIIKGMKNIDTNGWLKIGMGYVGFTHKRDTTFLNVQGKFIIQGSVSIEKGCRLDIGKNATLEIGGGSFINPFTKIIIQHGLKIGKNCSISWDCNFLDEDFHKLEYENRKELLENKIIIGDCVWIGSNTSVYKGSIIGKGSVIASNSVVKGKFEEENVLIAGNPAKIVKRNVHW